jgi:phosphate transport system substrate-binding protein
MIAILAMAVTARTSEARELLQIKGSDTLINLVQRLSEDYMDKYPGKMIAVTGGGSGTGIAALINGKCDIADASRLIKSKEIDEAQSRGVSPVRIIVAVDGLSIVVNEKNPVSELTVDQIGKVYRGEVKNWNELGGEDMPITLYGRQSNSGTFDFMKEEVLKGEFSPDKRRMNGNAQIIEAVKNDVSAIGYVGVGYAKSATGINVLKVARTAGGDYCSPLNTENVMSGRYPISRPLYQYVNGAPKGDIKAFIAFELSPEGQKVVEDEGFFAIPSEYKEYNTSVGM